MVNTLDAWNDTCMPLLLGVPWPDPTRCQEKRFTSMVPPGKGTATLMSRLKSKFKTRPSGDTVCRLLTQSLASTSTCLSVNLSSVYFSRNKPGNEVRRPWGPTKGLRFLWGQRGKEGGMAKPWILPFLFAFLAMRPLPCVPRLKNTCLRAWWLCPPALPVYFTQAPRGGLQIEQRQVAKGQWGWRAGVSLHLLSPRWRGWS